MGTVVTSKHILIYCVVVCKAANWRFCFLKVLKKDLHIFNEKKVYVSTWALKSLKLYEEFGN